MIKDSFSWCALGTSTRPRDKMPCFNWIIYFCTLAMKIQQDIPWGGLEEKLDWEIFFIQNFPLPQCIAFVAKNMLKHILSELNSYSLSCMGSLQCPSYCYSEMPYFIDYYSHFRIGVLKIPIENMHCNEFSVSL